MQISRSRRPGAEPGSKAAAAAARVVSRRTNCGRGESCKGSLSATFITFKTTDHTWRRPFYSKRGLRDRNRVADPTLLCDKTTHTAPTLEKSFQPRSDLRIMPLKPRGFFNNSRLARQI